MSRRKAITDKMKWQCLLYRQANFCAFCNEQLGPHSDIEWDHVWELADGGPHHYKNLRPICIDCHKKKSAKAQTQRAHIKRLERGPRKSKRPMKSAKRPWPKRKFPNATPNQAKG